MNDIEQRFELFKNAKTRQQLAEALGYKYESFLYLIYSKDIESHYTEFNIAKKYKGERQIAAPDQYLKRLQRNLADILLVIFNPKKCVHAFVKDKNIVTNARPHLKAHHILRLDLKDFFPSIHFGRVRNLFEADPFYFPREMSTAIARICCYKTTLPQGAPTSPIVSNMICLRMDAQLTRLARDNFCAYTRYADDITFSTNKNIFPTKIISSISPLELSAEIKTIIDKNYFSINYQKVNIRSHFDSKFIAGIKVNEKLNVSRKKYREIRAMLNALRVYGPDKALEEHISKYSCRKRSIPQSNFYNIIQGKIAFLGMVRGQLDPIISKLQNQLLQALELDSKKTNRRIIEKVQSNLRDDSALILCEGKTDRIYLSFALRMLKKNGFFNDLRLLFYVWTAAEGCSVGTWEVDKISKKGLLSRYSKHPKIYIFDRDIKSHENYVTMLKGMEHPKYWGENTWSFLLHEPDFRNGYGSSISIEHFFSDDLIFAPDGEGRRLYCSSQFDNGTAITDNLHSPSSAEESKSPSSAEDSSSPSSAEDSSSPSSAEESNLSSNTKKKRKKEEKVEKIFKLILDSSVFFTGKAKKRTFVLLGDDVQQGETKNIARSKFSLAQEIANSNIISDESLEEFKKIFEKIEKIIKKS